MKFYDEHLKMSNSLCLLSQAAFEAALGWKLMYLICREPRQFWAWQHEQELAYVFLEQSRELVQLPERAESLEDARFDAILDNLDVIAEREREAVLWRDEALSYDMVYGFEY